MNRGAVWGLLGVGLAVGVVVALRFWPGAEAPQSTPPVPAPANPPVAEPASSVLPPALQPLPPGEPAAASASPPADAPIATPPPLPPLNESDGFVRSQAAGFELPETWTKDDDLVRRFAVLIENVGKGEAPPKRLGVLSPAEKFPVRQEGDRFFLDPAGYARYDPYLDRLERLAPASLATFIDLLGPLFDEALLELGQQNDVDAAALAAIDRVLAAPALDGEIELVRPGLMFEYADPALEALGGLEKQLLRMGPHNTRRLQAYLQRLRPLLQS